MNFVYENEAEKRRMFDQFVNVNEFVNVSEVYNKRTVSFSTGHYNLKRGWVGTIFVVSCAHFSEEGKLIPVRVTGIGKKYLSVYI